jgi:magnesium transporter
MERNEFENEFAVGTVEILESADRSLPTPEELCRFIDEKEIKKIRELTADVPHVDMAEILSDMKKLYRIRLFRLLLKEQAAQVFVEMDAESQKDIIDAYSDAELSEMLSELYLDDTVDLIEEMPANVVRRIIGNSTRENRSIINRLLKYPKDSAGTIMTTEYVRLQRTMTVAEALDHLRRVAVDKETIYTAYITDGHRHLVGLVTARALLTSPLDKRVEDIMTDAVVYVNTTENREDVARKFDKYGFIALPVVDNECRLVGIITVDDAIDVMKVETEEDFAKMAAITPSEKPYLKTRVGEIWLARIPWLLLLMISATLSSTILNRFEAALPSVLILFVPMLMDTGGNSGSQSSVTLIRGLSLGEVSFSNILFVIWKELRVGILCGVSLGAVAFGKVMLVDRLLMSNTEVTLWVALSVSIALFATIVVAKLVGATLPLIAKKIGFDPAVMASPFITTVVDAVSLVLYFFIAKLMLGL